jgi:hypothetical protein
VLPLGQTAVAADDRAGGLEEFIGLEANLHFATTAPRLRRPAAETQVGTETRRRRVDKLWIVCSGEEIKPVLRVLLERQAFRVFCEAVTIKLLRGFP